MILSPNELLFGMLYSGLGCVSVGERGGHKITLKQVPIDEL